MTLSTYLAADSPNFHTLALFICHLFKDGNFRSAHLLYEPSAFDDRLLGEISLSCPLQIPWKTTDITQSSLPALLDTAENTDSILQLIFIDADYGSPEAFHGLRDQLTFYRVFIFYSIDGINVSKTITTLKTLSLVDDANVIVLIYSQLFDILNVYRIQSIGGGKVVFDQQQKTIFMK